MIIVDRILDGVAVCEAGGILMDIPLSEINGNVREGDVLCPDGERYTINHDEAQKRRTMLTERLERIKKRH